MWDTGTYRRGKVRDLRPVLWGTSVLGAAVLGRHLEDPEDPTPASQRLAANRLLSPVIVHQELRVLARLGFCVRKGPLPCSELVVGLSCLRALPEAALHPLPSVPPQLGHLLHQSTRAEKALETVC